MKLDSITLANIAVIISGLIVPIASPEGPILRKGAFGPRRVCA